MTIGKNIAVVKKSIDQAMVTANRQDQVTLIGVTKYHSVGEAQQVVAAGVTNLAENRPEGLAEKQLAFKENHDLKWHFIGSLQKRKVKKVINQIDYLHSLDRVELATEIQKRANQPVKCFIEVNVSGEESKSGVSLANVVPLVQEVKPDDKVLVVGLMTMAPRDANDEQLHRLFHQLKLKRDEVQALELPTAPCRELSMGMSHDYQIAILEGATFVRVGTALFDA
ncbi:YggS family pyridoxal phosphate-dependent enzyme [Loigolactobacillus iwatensis]|uniref:YggS family pyridoxal phosphate-dependent enzyme n=1 Tax=Loigolactobacillus iwatensis TaxID=1267156 RepID=UPI000F7FA56D|nr:YggS family pyridoxal phosphate-dependent enzyme [Loigolactobacillus iwatensis]